ncbi:ABC transporter substrate-binding protein [Eubacteriales bacterium OttesenSCG-928-A19]|nr:ABC transporter substrate-binding protein [Eubacteriales bacterium OttesenSCG-928-A19]
MRKILAFLLSALLILGLMPAMASAEAEGAVIKFGTDAEPIGFDPHTISAVASLRVINQLYNTLVNLDENLNVIPELAASWEQTDETTYVFHLREDVKFHNGRGMTAEDVKYSFERILDETVGALGNSPSYVGDIDTMTVVDDYTIEIKLKNVNAPFLANLSNKYCAIVCQEVVEENGDLLRADGGTGPFTLGEWVPDNMVSVVAFDDYFLEDLPKAAGIEFYVMTDESARLAALRTGSIDIVNATADMLPLVENDANIAVASYQSRNYSALCLNLNPEKFEHFQDVRVRQAISLALNREEIIDMAYNGEALVSGFVPPLMGRWAVDVESHPLYQQNIEQAKSLMEEAGYADGFDVVLTVGLLDSLRNLGAVVQQQLAEINIRVEIQNLENAQYVENWSAHDFEMMACQNGGGTDPSRAVAFFFKTGNSANIAEYSNERVDELCDLGLATSDEDARLEYYTEAINIILDECPNVVVASPREYFFTGTNVKDFAPTVSTPYDMSAAYIGE